MSVQDSREAAGDVLLGTQIASLAHHTPALQVPVLTT